VRSRGVMEKCTYCTQRIEAGKIAAKLAGRPLADGDVVPACAQACPTRAITFGNIRDGESQVAQRKAEPRNYTLLEDLFTKPRTSFLAKLRNPNPALEDHPA
jgi:Fe-S-cluster-containing dehydrogenase component